VLAALAFAADLGLDDSGRHVGLVAAYAFDEGRGRRVADASRNGNNGTVANATWSGQTAGKNGKALNFNGSSSPGHDPRRRLAAPDTRR
jgi:hypothetical protein